VQFKSLPLEEQKRLNALHDKKIESTKDKAQRQLDRLKRKEDRKKKRELKKKEKEKRLEIFKKMTPETHPNFFTSTGKRLNTTRGMLSNVKVNVNPDWNSETDNVYYAKQINPKNGRPLHFYTEDYIKKHDKIKFANNQRFNALLPKIREKYNADLKGDDPRNRVYATAVALVDQAAMRIGNRKSEANDVRGLHSLQTQHIKMSGSKVTISYTGKKKVAQKHEFEISEPIKKNLNELLKDKQPTDSVFTWDKGGETIRIAPTYVNRYLRYRLGSNVTIHHFRHHHGTLKAKEYLDKIDPSKLSRKQLDQTVKDASLFASEYLGNTPAVARKHYIDPAIFQDFYAKAGMKIASSNVIKKVAAAFIFKVQEISGKTLEEEKFNDDLWAMKLEDLQPYENIDFENSEF
jgi:DNA topoisomerase IB